MRSLIQRVAASAASLRAWAVLSSYIALHVLASRPKAAKVLRSPMRLDPSNATREIRRPLNTLTGLLIVAIVTHSLIRFLYERLM